MLNNQGYSSIRQTQKNYFLIILLAVLMIQVYPFLNSSRLASAFDIQYSSVKHSILDIDNSLFAVLLNLIWLKYFFPVTIPFHLNFLVVVLKMVLLYLPVSKIWLLSLTEQNLLH